MTITDRITLNLSGENSLICVHAKQGDISSRFVEVTFEHQGCFYPVPSTVTARAEFFRPDGTHVLNDELVQDGRVIVILTQQMLTVAGTAKCEIQLYHENKLITTEVFCVTIHPSAAPQSCVESDPDYSSFKNALIKVEGITNDAEESAMAAEQSAESAKASAEKAQTNETNSGKNAELAKTYANAAEKNVSAAAESAESAARSANSSETSAVNSQASEESAKQSAEHCKVEADRAKTEADRAAEIVGGDFATKAELSESVSESKTYTDIKAGEALDNAMEYTGTGLVAVAKSVSELGENVSAHATNADNPHCVTPSKIGAAIGDSEGSAQNSNKLGGVESGDFLTRRYSDEFAGALSYTLTVPRTDAVLRVKFAGKSVQSEIPQPTAPVTVKSINNPAFTVTYPDGTSRTVGISREFLSLPNGVRDEFDGYRMIRRIAKFIATQYTDIYMTKDSTTQARIFVIDLPAMLSRTLLWSSHYENRDGNDQLPHICSIENSITIYDQRFSSLEAFKQWLALNPVDIYYQLCEEHSEDVSVDVAFAKGENQFAAVDSSGVLQDVIMWAEPAAESGTAVNSRLLAGELPHTYVQVQPPINDNIYFRVWQRGESFTLPAGRIQKVADRWAFYNLSEVPVTVTSDSSGLPSGFSSALKFTRKDNTGTTLLRQYLTCPQIVTGLVTLTCLVKGPQGAIAAFDVNDGVFVLHTFTGGWDTVVRTSRLYTQMSGVCTVNVMRYIDQPGDYYICAAKLEPGERFTGWSNEKPGEELLECQRYYQIHNQGGIAPTELRPTMRINPTIVDLGGGKFAYDAEHV